jgi:hypothetical protein
MLPRVSDHDLVGCVPLARHGVTGPRNKARIAADRHYDMGIAKRAERTMTRGGANGKRVMVYFGQPDPMWRGPRCGREFTVAVNVSAERRFASYSQLGQ